MQSESFEVRADLLRDQLREITLQIAFEDVAPTSEAERSASPGLRSGQRKLRKQRQSAERIAQAAGDVPPSPTPSWRAALQMMYAALTKRAFFCDSPSGIVLMQAHRTLQNPYQDPDADERACESRVTALCGIVVPSYAENLTLTTAERTAIWAALTYCDQLVPVPAPLPVEQRPIRRRIGRLGR